MATTKTGDRSAFLKELIPFLQEQGFIWGPFPEIYGGFAGFYSYGPMGKLLKNKVEDIVRKTFQSHGFWELECPIVLQDKVWKASGHLDTFVDRAVVCSKCNAIFRADKLIEEKHDVSADSFSDKELLDFITKEKIVCPSCGGSFTQKIERKSLMMKTQVAGEDASLRPETATVTYLPFNRYYQFFRKKLPIGVFQIGKAFRNEISPRQHVIRSREFTQAEGQLFMDPQNKNNWGKFDAIKKETLPLLAHNKTKVESMSVEQALKQKHLSSQVYAWCLWLAHQQFINMGIPQERIRIREHHPDERAFYAADAWDIEVKLDSFGWVEMCGVHDRTDYDLTQHEKFSKENLSATTEEGKKITPHILEIAFGTDRPVFALLDVFYKKKVKDEGKTIFAVPYHLAPVDVALFPLMKKDGLPECALEIKKELEQHFVVDYDPSGSIGKRYLRAAQVGTPYCVTVDHDSLKKKDVTIRDRDSEKQIRVKTKELVRLVHELLHGKISFGKAGTLIK